MSSLLSSQLALALLSFGTASVDRVRRSSSECRARDAWRNCHVAAFLLLYTSFLSRVLLLFSTFSSREICGMNMPNLPEVSCLEDLLIFVCVRRATVAAIDAPLTKIVVAG